jgi:hypothetical protein
LLPRVFALLFGVSLVLIWWYAGWAGAKTAPRGPEVLPQPRSSLQYLGSGSCAAAACHGGDDPQGHWRSAHQTWITRDVHARAYQVLFNEQSRRIITYRGGKEAHTDTLCLSCHVHPDWRPEGHHPRFAVADGVGCESCHGPGERWLSRHVAADWATLSAADKRGLGWNDTKNLVTRAELCATCHVGTDKADVNHDLIAAGHPALKFELTAYHVALPTHWDARKDLERYPDFEVRAWKIGQVVSAKAALELLAARAGDQKRAWPEFAEHDCAACHHELRTAAPKRGTPPRSLWYTALLPRVSSVGDFADLDKEMAKLRPARDIVKARASLAAARLEGAADKLATEPAVRAEALHARFVELTHSEAKQASKSWDEATQLYQALAAHANAWRDLGFRTPHEDALRQSLRELAKDLTPDRGRIMRTDFNAQRVFDSFRRLERVD